MCGYCVRVCVVTGQVHAGVAQMVSECIGECRGIRTVRGTRSR